MFVMYVTSWFNNHLDDSHYLEHYTDSDVATAWNRGGRMEQREVSLSHLARMSYQPSLHPDLPHTLGIILL